MRRLGPALLILLLGIVGPVGALAKGQSPLVDVAVRLSKKSVTIGEPLTLNLSVKSRADIEIELPAPGKNLGDFAVRSSKKSRWALFGRQRLTEIMALAAYETGTLTVPKLTVRFREKGRTDWSEIETAEQKIDVRSLLAGLKGPAALRDIKPPVALRSRLGVYALAALAALGLFCLWFFRRAKKGVPPPPPPPRPAHEIALEQLEALRKKDLVRQGLIKKYYTEISDIVRRYIEDRFSLRAPEMTTQEFLAHARDSSVLNYEHQLVLKEFLEACDMVKFAKFIPEEAEADKVFVAAKNFVDQTRERPATAAVAVMQK